MAQRELKFDEWCAMWQCALERISAREAEFSELDAALGDGDHGQAIVGAMKVVVEKLSAGANFRSALGDAGMEVLMAVSGSTSTLLGALLLGMSDGVGAVDVIGAKDFKSMFGWGLKNVQQQTRALVGDKTMMDALIPAVDAILDCESEDIAQIMASAAEAAAKGAEATVAMQARFGRARNYGERSVGVMDSGAASWSCMIAAFAEALNN